LDENTGRNLAISGTTESMTATRAINKPTMSMFKITIGAIGIMLVFIVALMASEARSSKKSDESNTPRFLTVEQGGNKNIKELKGMPNAQLIPVMSFMSASLGVSCDFCHVSKDGKLDAAAEGKDEKNTARDMISMVRNINRRRFKGEPQVSCFTCHAGQALPKNFPGLPVAMISTSQKRSAQPTAAAPHEFPSGAAVINNYLNAIGGIAAIDRIKSCVITGKFVAANGTTGTFEIDQALPEKGLESITTSRFGRDRIVNQGVGWDKTPFGVSEMLPQQVRDVQLRLPLLLDVGLKDQYSELTVSAKTQIENQIVYEVDATRKDDRREKLYVDVETALLVRRITYTPTMVGIMPEQIDFSDYREVQGVKFPFSIRVFTTDPTNPNTTRTVDDVKLNVPIDESKFNKPFKS
jgi:Photosynthetic reaction centre cytochrome C subunit